MRIVFVYHTKENKIPKNTKNSPSYRSVHILALNIPWKWSMLRWNSYSSSSSRRTRQYQLVTPLPHVSTALWLHPETRSSWFPTHLFKTETTQNALSPPPKFTYSPTPCFLRKPNLPHPLDKNHPIPNQTQKAEEAKVRRVRNKLWKCLGRRGGCCLGDRWGRNRGVLDGSTWGLPSGLGPWICSCLSTTTSCSRLFRFSRLWSWLSASVSSIFVAVAAFEFEATSGHGDSLTLFYWILLLLFSVQLFGIRLKFQVFNLGFDGYDAIWRRDQVHLPH